MPKRSSKRKEAGRKKRSTDEVQLARQIFEEAIGQPLDPEARETPAKNPAAVALGRLGGLKGGKARAEKLSARKRKAIAKKAAEARWSKRAG